MKVSLKAARINAGLTQDDVSRQTGWARSTIKRWERYETAPPARKRKILCELYDAAEEEISWKSEYTK